MFPSATLPANQSESPVQPIGPVMSAFLPGRRDFLRGAAAAALPLGLYGCASGEKKQDHLVVGGLPVTCNLTLPVACVGKEAAIVQPSETFFGAEIWSWHEPVKDQPNNFSTKTKRNVRMAYFTDGHAAVTSEDFISGQCAPPSAPGIGLVP